MKRTLAVIVVGMFMNTSMVCAQDQGKPSREEKLKDVPVVTIDRPISFWMARKLEYSKKILEALTSGNFEELESNADQMRLLGKIEGFVRRKDADYTTHLHTFEQATREISRQSRSRNIEGATLAFHQLTTSCVNCHKVLREKP